MAAKENTVASRIIFDDLLELQREFKSRALPGEPLDLASELPIELLELGFTVRARRDSNGPIGMEVVNVVKREECVKRSIDGRRYFVRAKSRKGIVADHLIFELLTAIQLF